MTGRWALELYRPENLDEVRALHAAAFRTLAASHHGGRQIAAHEALIAAPEYAEDLAASHLMLAREADDGLAGTAGWIAADGRPGFARIRKVFVRPDLARRSLASLLVRDAEARARAAGFARLTVRANVNAAPLYEKLGYVAVRPGVMSTPVGIDLPVVFMDRPA
jgi:putative acetyltransferase